MTRSMLAVLLAMAIATQARAAGYHVVPPPLPPPSGPIEAQGEAWIADWAREFHEPPGRYDAKALALAAKVGARPNEPREAYFNRLMDEVRAADSDFAPLGAVHDDSVRYRLPFPLEMPSMVSQGVNGPFTHQGQESQAFDFAMPTGSPVVAARDGTVARVHDGFSGGGLEDRFARHANNVIVLHADGTFAVYEHLAKGVPVHVGQAVKQGDTIGRSGNTGLTAGPHLHFAVYKRDSNTTISSVPIRFGVGSPKGFVPEQYKFYGGKPKQTVGLIVNSGGAPLSEANPLRLAKGARASLSVAMVPPGLPAEDVTRAAATHFFAPTGWSIVVDTSGNVTAKPTADYAAALAKMSPAESPPGATNWGVVVVSYEDEPKGHFGFFSVPVLVGDAAH